MANSDIEQVGFLLHETARVWRTKLDQRLKPLGLSMGKWTTLVHLSRGGDKLTQAEIAARVGVEEPTLAGILDRLEQDGWVKRQTSTEDRRCKTVQLQKRSVGILDQISNTAKGLRLELLEDISAKDLAACTRVLTQIRDRAGAVSMPGVRSANEPRSKKTVLTPSPK